MKHKHYEMIVAKAANMELVVFGKSKVDKATGEPIGWSILCESNEMNWLTDEGRELFLCLPQHKEACLHWLNGGELYINNGKGLGEGNYTLSIDIHNPLADFIGHPEYQFRIKPKKEKRWIAVNPLTGSVELFGDEKVLDNCLICPEYKSHQKIEIEVEV